MPRVHLSGSEEVAGVTFYRVEVSQEGDERGRWGKVHRFSSFCSLDYQLRKELAAYAEQPPAASIELQQERRSGAGGSILASQAARASRQQRRMGLLTRFMEMLVSTVEILASDALGEFLDLRQQVIDTRPLVPSRGVPRAVTHHPGISPRQLPSVIGAEEGDAGVGTEGLRTEMPVVRVFSSDLDARLGKRHRAETAAAAAAAVTAAAANITTTASSSSGGSSSSSGGGGGGGGKCDMQVLALRGCEGADEGTRVLLSALAATAFLPGDSRFEAMLLAQRGEGTASVALVHAALEEESRRRLALKALSGLSSE